MHILHPFSPLRRSAMLLVLIFALGTLGYWIVGYPQTSWLDALYMTVITLTTVGFGEIVDLQHKPEGRAFTIGLLFLGVGTFVYFISNLTAFLVEGRLADLLWRRRMRRTIDGLVDHIIVCGCGHTGEAVIEELIHTDRPFVVVERDDARILELERKFDREFAVVIGDASDDDVLRAAGIGRASGLVATVSSDKDNLIVTVSARMLNPKLRIAARCIDARAVDKMRKAGADSVVSPNVIGGMRLVSELVRPHTVDFLDIMLRDRDQRLRVEEVTAREGGPLAGRTLGALRADLPRSVLIVALRRADGGWTYNPADEAAVPADGAVVFLGDPAGRALFERLAR